LSEAKHKERIESSKKRVTHRVTGILNKINISSETTETRRQWDDIFRVLKKNYQLRILYPANNLLKTKRDKQKPRESITSSHALKEILRESLRLK